MVTVSARPRWRGSSCPSVIPGRAKREPGIHRAAELVDKWIPGLRQAAHPGMTVEVYLIFSYAAAKSASGIGMEMTSLARFWNETLSCLPDFIAASMSAGIGVLA